MNLQQQQQQNNEYDKYDHDQSKCEQEEDYLCNKCSQKYDISNRLSSQHQQQQQYKQNDNDEEIKEEETECYYCIKSNQTCNEAVLLYKGKACCLQCKQSNIVNYIAAPDGKQRTIVFRRQESDLSNNLGTSSPSSNKNNNLQMTQSSTSAFIKRQNGIKQPFPASTKNQNSSHYDKSFFSSQQTNHQKHQSEMITNKYHGDMNNNEDESNYNHKNLPQLIKPTESISYLTSQQSQEQNSQKQSTENTPKHQKNSQTDPFMSRMYQSKDIMSQSNNLMNSVNLNSNYIHQPTTPQILIKDAKIEQILKEIQKKGLSYVQKKAVLSLMENKKDFTSQKYHEKLDKKKQILYIVILKSGFIFGGFHYAQLKSQKERSIEDMQSGLFSMQGTDINFYPVDNNKIIYFDNGVWFGKPPSLIINFDMLDKCFCNKEFIFLTPQGMSQTLSFGPTTNWNQIIQDICILQF